MGKVLVRTLGSSNTKEDNSQQTCTRRQNYRGIGRGWQAHELNTFLQPPIGSLDLCFTFDNNQGSWRSRYTCSKLQAHSVKSLILSDLSTCYSLSQTCLNRGFKRTTQFPWESQVVFTVRQILSRVSYIWSYILIQNCSFMIMVNCATYPTVTYMLLS